MAKSKLSPVGRQRGIVIITGETQKWEKGELESLQEQFREKYGVELSNSLKRADARAAKDALRAIQSILIEHPELVDTLEEVKYNGRVKSALAQATTRYDYKSGALASTVELCQSYKSYDWIQSYDHDGRGWHPPHANAESVAAHEMGHVYEAAIVNRREQKGGKRWSSMVSRVHTAGVVEAAKAKTGGKAGDISEYAMESHSETMAEAFADVYANGPKADKLSREIVKESKRRLRG